MTTVADIQRALIARGYDLAPYGADGDIGPTTLGAALQAIQRLPVTTSVPPVVSAPQGVVPADWMPWAKMLRVIVHWTAGAHKASSLDKEHYHIMIEGDGNLVRGKHSIADNVSTADGVYAAHTKGCNSGSIGVSLCGMAGAKESPFDRGNQPLTQAQWQKLPRVLADLCRRYAINPRRTTVLSHAEVEKTLGIKQAGKWDIRWIPGAVGLLAAKDVGDRFRAATQALL